MTAQPREMPLEPSCASAASGHPCAVGSAPSLACPPRCPFQASRGASKLAVAFKGMNRAFAAAVLALAGSLTVTLGMWSSAIEEGASAARERFQFRANEVEFAVRQRLLAYEQVLRGGVALFAASETVSREEWRSYVHTVAIERNYPGIQGIGFALHVRPEALAAHVAAVRGNGFPLYDLSPSGERPEYTAIVYLEPFDWRNRRAFGFDMFSEPVRRAAMIQARDSGLASMSGKVQLMQETDRDVQSGFLMYLPVYRNGMPLDSLEARRAALMGYVYAPFRMNDLMRGILGQQAQPDLDLHIHDGAVVSPESLLYDSSPEHSAGRAESAFSRVAAIDFNGHRWTLEVASLAPFEAGIDVQKPRLILSGGILVSLLFAAFVWSSALNRRRALEIARANRGLQDEIAERTRLAADLERAKNAAEAANEAKSNFLATVSHELRTPLTLILAPLDELLGAGTPPRQRREELLRIQRNALVLLNRVNDLLDFAKAEAGKFEVCWECFDPAEVVGPIAEDAAAVAARKGCALDWRVDPELGSVCLDRSHFEKIVLNLVDNALKFTPSGGAIGIAVAADEAQRIRLEVADSGIGIPPDRQAQLFTRFHQVDGSTTRQYGGTGIGLALVKELAELMGGEVSVESAPGEGSRFRVVLPRVDPAPGDAFHPRSAAERTALQGALRGARFGADGPEDAAVVATPRADRRASGARVLLADDNPDMRAYVARLLGEDYRVVEAADGEEAWRLLQAQAVDLVVSDVMMPNVDGLELAARIKASSALSHVPVILVTARGGAEACVSGLDSGADDYLTKPFSPDELRARVRAALRLAEAQAQLREKAREAGMATVAAGVLHNVGNALTGVSVAAGIMDDKLRHLRIGKLRELAGLLPAHEPGHEEDATARTAVRRADLAAYVSALADHLVRERDALLDELAALQQCTAHIAGVIAAQQRFAGSAQVLRERVAADDLMETALALGRSAFDMEGIEVECDFHCAAVVEVDRHLALQILLNLLSNACHALRGRPAGSAAIRLRTAAAEGRVRLAVCDNGAGIEAEHLSRLFGQGFTTRSDGHGYGLHSSANWARELGGMLACHSDGPGRGACFTLELPAVALCDAGRPSALPAVAGG